MHNLFTIRYPQLASVMVAFVNSLWWERLFSSLESGIPRRVGPGIPPTHRSRAVLVPIQNCIKISASVHGGPIWESISPQRVVERVDEESRRHVGLTLQIHPQHVDTVICVERKQVRDHSYLAVFLDLGARRELILPKWECMFSSGTPSSRNL